MLLLLRLQLFAAALLVFLAFDGVNAFASEMYYRAVSYKGSFRYTAYQFHVEYCWRKNPRSKDECLQDGNSFFNTLVHVIEGFSE